MVTMSPVIPGGKGGEHVAVGVAPESRGRKLDGTPDYLKDVESIRGPMGRFNLDDRYLMLKFIRGEADGDVDHMLSYDITKLIKIGGLFSCFMRGTIFTMDGSLYKNVLGMLFTMVLVIALLLGSFPSEKVAAYDIKSLEDLNLSINRFFPFVLAFYVKLTLYRWWKLRILALAKVFDSFASVNLSLSAIVPGPKWREARMQVIKYGMASIHLMIMAARGQTDLISLADENLLSKRDLELLEDIKPFQRAMICWSWIGRITEQLIIVSKASPARQNGIISKVMSARDGINTIHTYLDTQLPFAYVHLISFVVNVQNLTLAAKCGAAFAIAWSKGELEAVANQVVIVALVGIVCQGLLSLSYVIQDPFGDDLLDFPINHYVLYVAQTCAAMERAASECPGLDELRIEELASDFQ